MKKITLLSAIAIFFFGSAFGQEKGGGAKKYLPSIGLHGGGLSYSGDIEGAVGSNIFTFWKPAYGFYLEKKLSPIIGITANGTFGKVSKSQLDEQVFLNFETSVSNYDLNLLFDFDNGKIINAQSPFAPFVSVGFGFVSFNPMGDLFSGSTFYHHWDDGTLRDVPQYLAGSDTSSNVIIRDHTYESELVDSTTNYSKSAFTIPIRFGLKFEVSEHIDVRFTGAYMLTTTDYLDNVAGGGNDKMFYTSFGLQYNFESKTAKNDKYKDFSFSALDNEDSDGDGVVDYRDLCQGTPKGVQVDSKGCALDGDGDGVPDYKDKEVNTAKGVVVNRYGQQLTDEMLSKNVLSDSVETKYSTFSDKKDLNEKEFAAIRDRVNSKQDKEVSSKNIPAEWKKFDVDKNGYISAKEMNTVVDDMEQDKSLSVAEFNRLLNFYFEQ